MSYTIRADLVLIALEVFHGERHPASDWDKTWSSYDVKPMSLLENNSDQPTECGIYISENGKYIIHNAERIVQEGSFDTSYIPQDGLARYFHERYSVVDSAKLRNSEYANFPMVLISKISTVGHSVVTEDIEAEAKAERWISSCVCQGIPKERIILVGTKMDFLPSSSAREKVTARIMALLEKHNIPRENGFLTSAKYDDYNYMPLKSFIISQLQTLPALLARHSPLQNIDVVKATNKKPLKRWMIPQLPIINLNTDIKETPATNASVHVTQASTLTNAMIATPVVSEKSHVKNENRLHSSTKNEDIIKRKVVILGSPVGKTCLLTKLIDNSYTDRTISTIGVNFYCKKYKDTIKGDEKTLEVRWWDTSGAESHRAISMNYTKSADFNLIALDLSADVSSLKYEAKKWAELFSRSEISAERICWVGTQSDLVDSTENAIEKIHTVLRDNNISESDYRVTSAKTGIGVLELENYIVYHKLKNLPPLESMRSHPEIHAEKKVYENVQQKDELNQKDNAETKIFEPHRSRQSQNTVATEVQNSIPANKETLLNRFRNWTQRWATSQIPITNININTKEEKKTANASSHVDQINTLTQIEFNVLVNQLETVEKRCFISSEMLDEKLKICKQEQQVASHSFSSKDAKTFQALFIKYKEEEILLLERKTILSIPEWEDYYRAIRVDFSGLMVASLGIGRGFVQVSQSKNSKAFKYVTTAIGLAFPTHHVSVITSAASDMVRFLDSQARKSFLAKINVFKNTLTEAEILGEKVARFLLRARVHAGNKISPTQSDKDSQDLITAILKTDKKIVHNEDTAKVLLEMMLGNIPYCIDPLLSQVKSTDTKLSIEIKASKALASQPHRHEFISKPTNTVNSVVLNAEDTNSKIINTDEKKESTAEINSPSSLSLDKRVAILEKMIKPSTGKDIDVGSGDTKQLLLHKDQYNSNDEIQTMLQNERHEDRQQIQLLTDEMGKIKETLANLIPTLDSVPIDINSEIRRLELKIFQKELEKEKYKQDSFALMPNSVFSDLPRLEKEIDSLKIQLMQLKQNKTETNILQAWIKDALITAVDRYFEEHKNALGIFHGGKRSKDDGKNLKIHAEKSILEQLAYLNIYLDPTLATSSMRDNSLIAYVVEELNRGAQQKEIDILKDVSSVSASSSSNTDINKYKCLEIQRALAELQKKLSSYQRRIQNSNDY